MQRRIVKVEHENKLTCIKLKLSYPLSSLSSWSNRTSLPRNTRIASLSSRAPKAKNVDFFKKNTKTKYLIYSPCSPWSRFPERSWRSCRPWPAAGSLRPGQSLSTTIFINSPPKFIDLFSHSVSYLSRRPLVPRQPRRTVVSRRTLLAGEALHSRDAVLAGLAPCIDTKKYFSISPAQNQHVFLFSFFQILLSAYT